ncbi:MAG: hypothetical protein ABIN00_06635 [candidate division WOR-3 bacterium]
MMEYIFYLIISISFSFSLFILYKLIPITGSFIPGMMGFVFTASLIFLLFEKKIILGFKNNFKTGLLLSIPLIGFYILFLFQLNFFDPFMVIFMLFLSYKISSEQFITKKYDIFYVLIMLVIFIFFNKLYSDLKLFAYSLISIFIQIILFKIFKQTQKFKISSVEKIFYPYLLGAIILTTLYFFNKPGQTPEINQLNQIFLSIYVFVSNFLLSLFMIKYENLDLKKIDKDFLFSGALIFTLILFLNIPDIILFFLVFISMLKKFFLKKGMKKGFGVSEYIAILTMAAIIFSLLIPSIKVIKNKIVAIHDCETLNNGKNDLKNIYIIDGIYIKFIDKKPSFVYSKTKDRFRYLSIQ